MAKKYIVDLDAEEQEMLTGLIASGTMPDRAYHPAARRRNPAMPSGDHACRRRARSRSANS